MTLVPLLPDVGGERRIAGQHHTTVAQRPQVLGRVEREAARTAERARRRAVGPGADRLRGILDHPLPAALGECRERTHRGEPPEEMDG